jgi:hypothetical protein
VRSKHLRFQLGGPRPAGACDPSRTALTGTTAFTEGAALCDGQWVGAGDNQRGLGWFVTSSKRRVTPSMCGGSASLLFASLELNLPCAQSLCAPPRMCFPAKPIHHGEPRSQAVKRPATTGRHQVAAPKVAPRRVHQPLLLPPRAIVAFIRPSSFVERACRSRLRELSDLWRGSPCCRQPVSPRPAGPASRSRRRYVAAYSPAFRCQPRPQPPWRPTVDAPPARAAAAAMDAAAYQRSSSLARKCALARRGPCDPLQHCSSSLTAARASTRAWRLHMLNPTPR